MLKGKNVWKRLSTTRQFDLVVLMCLLCVVCIMVVVAFFASTTSVFGRHNSTIEFAARASGIKYDTKTQEHIVTFVNGAGDNFDVSLTDEEYHKYLSGEMSRVIIECTTRNGKSTYKILGVSQ